MRKQLSLDTHYLTLKDLTRLSSPTSLQAGHRLELTLLSPNPALYPSKAQKALQPREQTRILPHVLPLFRQSTWREGRVAEAELGMLPFPPNSPLPPAPVTTRKQKGRDQRVPPGQSLLRKQELQNKLPQPSAGWIWPRSLHFCFPDFPSLYTSVESW